MDLLNEAVKKTIKYGQGFNCTFNDEEIKERLISKNYYDDKEIKKVIEKNRKNTSNDIRGEAKNVVDKKYLKEKVKKAKKLSELIEDKFKDIIFLGISGSVASNYPKKNDDIDLLIICKNNKLWWTRLKLRWWIFIKRIPHRRFKQKEKKDQFCFNLWLDEKGLLLPNGKRNLQNGMDLMMMKVLINKNRIYENFLLKNDWVKEFLINGYERKIKKIDKDKIRGAKDNIKINYKKNSLLNFSCFWIQYWYMNKRITQEIVNYHQAFFHS